MNRPDLVEDEFALGPALRNAIYALVIISSLASCLGRVITVRSKDSRGPFLSANDRSRWCTIRALVESNTFVIDRLQRDRQWQTIDKVQHVGRDGKLHFYSSKPPLFPTMVAGQYWVINRLTGATFKHHPFPLARTILVLTNLLPLALYFWLAVGLIHRWCETDWARLFAVTCLGWGTFLTTFAVTLNNHLPAAICTLICLHVFIAIWYDQQEYRRYYFIAGLAAAFTFANELPALSLLGLLGLALLYHNARYTLLYGVPAVLLVIVPYFVINYVAHDSWRPPYAHRNAEANDDWYDYEGSHWRQERKGVDAGEPSKLRYVVHCLVGHHGILSLTPIWCYSVLGIWWLASDQRETPMPALAVGIALLTCVCLGFYLLLRPEIDRNYGGVTSGFRWAFWFTPLWLFAMLPALDRAAYSSLWRKVGYAALAVSVLSASYPGANPWQHPWPYQIMEYLNLV